MLMLMSAMGICVIMHESLKLHTIQSGTCKYATHNANYHMQATQKLIINTYFDTLTLFPDALLNHRVCILSF